MYVGLNLGNPLVYQSILSLLLSKSVLKKCLHNLEFSVTLVLILLVILMSTFRVTFCAEHARRNAMALQAQLRKASSGPSPEALLSQLSGYNRPETHGLDSGRSEATRILGE
jgi:hypothetical protein